MRVLDFVHKADAWWHDLRHKESAGAYMLGAGPAYRMLLESFSSLMEDSTQHQASEKQPITIGIATAKGPRPRNEDSAVAFVTQVGRGASAFPLAFAAVADGMGGQPAGDVASAITIKTLAEHVLEHLIWPEVEGKTGEYSYSAGQILHILRLGVNEANRAVLAEAQGAGTTVTCLLLRGLDVYLAHVGDSRAYWIHGDGLNVLTHDHSIAQYLVEAGYVTSEQAEKRQRRNLLYRGVGIEDEIEVDLVHQDITADSSLLLCTDGLWSAVSEDVIHDLTVRGENPDRLCATLVDTAISAGTRDNATAVAIHVSE